MVVLSICGMVQKQMQSSSLTVFLWHRNFHGHLCAQQTHKSRDTRGDPTAQLPFICCHIVVDLFNVTWILVKIQCLPVGIDLKLLFSFASLNYFSAVSYSSHTEKALWSACAFSLCCYSTWVLDLKGQKASIWLKSYKAAIKIMDHRNKQLVLSSIALLAVFTR